MMLLLLLYINLSLLLIHVSAQNASMIDIKALTEEIRQYTELQEIPEELSQLKEFYELCKNLSRISDIYHIQKEINLAADIKRLLEELFYLTGFKHYAKEITELIKIIDSSIFTTIYFTNENGGRYDGNIFTELLYNSEINEVNRLTSMVVYLKNSYQLKQDVALLTNIDRLTEEKKKLKQRSAIYIEQLRQNIVQYKDINHLTHDISQLKGQILKRIPEIRKLKQKVVQETDKMNSYLVNDNRTVNAFVECEHNSIRSVLGMHIMQVPTTNPLNVHTLLGSKFVMKSKYYRSTFVEWSECLSKLLHTFNETFHKMNPMNCRQYTLRNSYGTIKLTRLIGDFEEELSLYNDNLICHYMLTNIANVVNEKIHGAPLKINEYRLSEM